MKKEIREQLIIILAFLIVFFVGSCTGGADKSSSKAEKSVEFLPIPAWIGDGSIIIDANVGLGRFANGDGADFAQPGKAIEHFRAAGINGALAYSVLSR